MAEQLKEKVYEALKEVEAKEVGVAFSGGVDSSLLAKVCKDVGKKVVLITVGFLSQRDIGISDEVSKALSLTLFHDLVSLEELEEGLETVLAIIEFDRIIRLENCVSFYYVFRLASKRGLDTVLSANGIDELFCGYHVYRQHFGEEPAIRGLIEAQVELARKDNEEVNKLAKLFSVEYVCPFLSVGFVEFAKRIPLKFKIKGKDDTLRKHIIREVALEVGVPESAALRAKKAFQYSSGLHSAIAELSRRKGFTRKKARAIGLQSGIEAYIKSLKGSLAPKRSSDR